MYSDKDFQTFPYKQFYAWFKKHAKDTVIPVEIEGAPTDEEKVPPQPSSKPKAKHCV